MRVLLFSALLGASVAVRAEELCPAGAADRVLANPGAVLSPCLSAMTKAKQELARVGAPESGATAEERARAVERYDALLADMTAVRAKVSALKGDERMAFDYVLRPFNARHDEFRSPKVQALRNTLVPAGVEPANPELPT
ncbi:hypothetical protein EPO15_07435, partial [bacterium]